MSWIFNLVYLLALLVLSPWLIYKALTTGKYRRNLGEKLTGRSPCHLVTLSPCHSRPRVWFHGVSVGEIHLLRQVVAAFRKRHPDWDCVISSTTDTGLDEARKHFPDLTVFAWPFDFSWAVRRALRRVRPDLVVLAESELWPNFLLAAEKEQVPVVVINARMSPRSARRFSFFGPLTRWLFGKVSLFATQTEEYADNLRRLGADRVAVTGSVKYDGVNGDRANAKTQELRRLFGIAEEELVWVAGSTQAPEEAIALETWRRLWPAFPRLRLIIVPRQKDRFDEVAELLRRSGEPFARRSEVLSTQYSVLSTPIVLVDTIGELGAVWGLADVAFVGGSLDGKRGGQNMIEPAAYGSAVLFGPHVWNFREAAARLTACGGAVQVADADALEREVGRLLSNEGERRRMGEAARAFVRQQQGATERTMTLLDEFTPRAARAERAA